MRILPATLLGRVAVALAAIGLVAYAVAIAYVDDVASPVYAWGAPVAAMVVGAVLAGIAILRRGDRAILAYAALVPGAFFLVLLLAEAVGLLE